MPWPTILTFLLRALLLGRHRLVLENLALRQQLAVLERKVPHPQLHDRDRLFWLLMRGIHDPHRAQRWRTLRRSHYQILAMTIDISRILLD
jgi:hypothetical protein